MWNSIKTPFVAMVFGLVVLTVALWDRPLEVIHAQRIPPGTGSGVNITSGKTTVVKGTQGVLLRIIVQTQVGAATIKLYDIASAGCTGTPGSGLLGTITLPATITSVNPFVLEYETAFTAGICLVTSGNTDILAVYE